MKRSHWMGLFVIGLLCTVGLPGCQQRPAVPTVELQPTEPVVVVVVTATNQPTLAPSSTPEATITPLPSMTPIVTATITTTLQVTATKPATKVAQVKTAVPAGTAPPAAGQPSPVPQSTAAPSSFPAPNAIGPEGKAFRDGDTLGFTFASVGPLGPNQCYRVDMTLAHPTGPGGVGDYWVGLCGNQSASGDQLVMQVKSGRFRDSANYGTLISNADTVIPPTPQYTMLWAVTVVNVLDQADPVHPKTQAISPSSAALQNTFFR